MIIAGIVIAWQYLGKEKEVGPVAGEQKEEEEELNGEQEEKEVMSITVLSPNGGEEWVVGNTYNIKWKSEGVEKVNIGVIWQGGGEKYSIISNLDDSSENYSWIISDFFADLEDDSKFKIIIDNGNEDDFVMDTSDDYFNIMK